MNDTELRKLFQDLTDSRQDALDQLSTGLGRLFEEKLMKTKLEILREVDAKLAVMNTGLALTKLKVAAILSVMTIVSSGLSAWIVKALISVVVVK